MTIKVVSASGGQHITNFRFADDIVVNAEEEVEAGILNHHKVPSGDRSKQDKSDDKQS